MKAVLVIDVQNDFVTGSLGSTWAEQVTPLIENFVSSIKGNKDYMIFATRDTHKDNYLTDTLEGKKLPVPHCIRGTYGWQLCNNLLESIPSHHIINKPTFMCEDLPANLMHASVSAGYTAEDIVDSQDLAHIDEIILVGFCTSICVVSNALYLRGCFPDKKITVYENLCADINKESHDAALKVMQNCQIDIETYNEK